jgi:hypothetical protein
MSSAAFPAVGNSAACNSMRKAADFLRGESLRYPSGREPEPHFRAKCLAVSYWTLGKNSRVMIRKSSRSRARLWT